MTIKTIEKVIERYVNADRLIQQFDLRILKKALIATSNTYGQAVCVAEMMNRKQCVINLCRIVEEILKSLKCDKKKKTVFESYLCGASYKELCNLYGVSLRTVFRYIETMKQSLLVLINADRDIEEELNDCLRCVLF